MNEIKLNNCPFCGGESIISEIDYTSKVFRIYCEDCPATMELSFKDAKIGSGAFISFYEMTKIIYDITNSWNTRFNVNDAILKRPKVFGEED